MRFRDEYAFLSNFYYSPVEFDGHTYRTAEHAYQAAKTLDETDRAVVRGLRSPGAAKKLGQTVVLRPDWEQEKVSIMRQILQSKFSNQDLAERLAAVEGPIAEDNYWGDTFWGCCNGVGENHLGRLLMEIRDAIS